MNPTFSTLGLLEPLQRALQEELYVHPTPIQEQAIPPLLEGRDLLGCARTGTGKTAAFALPILQQLADTSRAHGRKPRALVLVPTRELAAQVALSFQNYGRHVAISVAVVYGGVGQGPQVDSFRRGVDVVVATPGRLLDLMGQGHARLDHVEVLVLDEADHMLDLGFIPAVRRILSALTRRKQTLLFSDTMPPPIAQLADRILTHPVKVFVTPAATPVEEVDQRVHFVEKADKPAMLARLLSDAAVRRVLVFTRTKHGADHVARRLARDGIPAQAIHGNKSQGSRERSLHGFRNGHTRVLVATDIAARGIDIDDITHVINYELPNVPETYVHRIGRTARAGASGTAISLCDVNERPFLRDIEKLIKRSIPGSSRHARDAAPALPAAPIEREAEPRPQPERALAYHSPRRQEAPRQHHAPHGQGHHPQAASRPKNGQHGHPAKHGGHGHGQSHSHAAHSHSAPSAPPRRGKRWRRGSRVRTPR